MRRGRTAARMLRRTVPEGFNAGEASKEIREHAEHSRHRERDRWVTIVEAIVLSVVTLTAAWAGFSAAKFSTEASLNLAKASSTRAKANRAYQESLDYRIGDALVFNAWIGAETSGNQKAVKVTRHRFSPQLEKAFEAWVATHPLTNPKAPKGPQAMPQYHAPGEAQATTLDSQAQTDYDEGEHDAHVGDDYVRVTVILASVLFLVGISSHFNLRNVRLGLIAVAVALLLIGAVEIATLPVP